MALLWAFPDQDSLEYFDLTETNDAIVLEGTVVLCLDQRAARVNYRIECAPDWTTRRALITQDYDGQARTLDIRVDQAGRWFTNDQPVAFAAGLTDIDLSVTPSTNLLPIRRFNLNVGEAREVTAVWVRFPSLTLEPLHQRYTRVDEQLYQYEGLSTGFSALLEVDEFATVVRYGDYWRRVRPG
jgi:hypothetical protein